MKKILIICLMMICSMYIFAKTENTSNRPTNVPVDAEWKPHRWTWEYGELRNNEPTITWGKDGKVSIISYDSEDKKYRISEIYYDNGKLKKRYQTISWRFFNEKHKNRETEKYTTLYASKYYEYHENGRLKNDKCYTIVINNAGKLAGEPCGIELTFDENGKEIERVDHKIACEYGCEEAPRQTEKQIVDKIRKNRNIHLTYKPIVGKIDLINKQSKEIDIKYNEDYPLEVGDEIVLLVDDEPVIMNCKGNKSGIGQFVLKVDKYDKFSSIKKNMDPHYYKANEIKNEDFINKKIKPKAGDVIKIGGIEFVYIPSGEGLYTEDDFVILGPKSPEKKNNKKKVHKRHVAGFWISKYVITLGEYLKYLYEIGGSGSNANKEKESFVSRYPALDTYGGSGYCDWFSKKYGVNARLPYVDEWEYAARGGTTTDYYWGNDKIDDYCWYAKNSGKKIHQVGEKKPNSFGLYDMIGNVWEQCYQSAIVGGSAFSGVEDFHYGVRYFVNDVDFYTNYVGIEDPYKDLRERIGFRVLISWVKK